MFNFNFSSVSQVRIGDAEGKGLYVDIPQYKDLLANEYIQFEALDKADAEWNNRLVAIAQSLATSKEMNIWDVVATLDTLDNMDNAAKADFLGDKMVAMSDLAASKPSPRQKQLKMITIILNSRVSPQITEAEVSKLPQTFLQGIADFIYQEQMGGEHVPYSSLKNQYESALAKLVYAEQVVDAAAKINPEEVSTKELFEALDEYNAYNETLGKLV